MRLFCDHEITPADLHGQRVTVMGLGLFGGGRGLTEFLCNAGARVTVTDLRDADTLSDSIELLKHLPIQWELGKHHERDFVAADRVFVNPAVPRDHQLLLAAVARGVPLDTEMNLFFRLCRGRICGITGSNGKTTTTTLTGAMFRNHFESARLGGNLGRSLLTEVDAIGPDDWVILELSSFQLEDLSDISRRPDISLVTNLSPNHLNRHKTYRAYEAAAYSLCQREPESIYHNYQVLYPPKKCECCVCKRCLQSRSS